MFKFPLIGFFVFFCAQMPLYSMQQQQKKCALCKEMMSQEIQLQLSCKHTYHPQCLKDWVFKDIDNNLKCPASCCSKSFGLSTLSLTLFDKCKIFLAVFIRVQDKHVGRSGLEDL